MNPRILPVFAVLAAVAAAAWFFFSSGPSRSAWNPIAESQPSDKAAAAHAGGADEKGPAPTAPGNSRDSAGKKPAMNWKRFSQMMSGTADNSSSVPMPTSEGIARSLAKHGETAVNLVAAFETTRDRRLLERALELFPNSPVVLMAAIEPAPGSKSLKPGETYLLDAGRMALIERFKIADSNNPLPWIYSAQEFFKAGQTADAIADIRAALDRPAFYTYSNERMDSRQQFYEDVGFHPVEASLLAMAGLTLPHLPAAHQALVSLMEWHQSATDSGDTAAANDALRLTYGLSRTFTTPEASRTLIGQVIGIAMEARVLRALPTDAQPDWLTVNPAQRLAEMDRQKQNAKEIAAGLEWMIENQKEETLSEYVRRMRSEGESAAFAWLKAQKK